MISKKYKAIFVHVPKTASTSIENALGEVSFEKISYPEIYEKPTLVKHGGNANRVGIALPTNILDEYFKFAFVRNPYARVYSAWKMLKNFKHINLDFEPFVDLLPELFRLRMSRKLLQHAPQLKIRFKTLVSLIVRGSSNNLAMITWHVLPQTTHLCFKDEILANYIGRFENLNEDFREVCSRLCIKNIPDLPFLNSTGKVNLERVYSKKIKEKVYQTYEDDFKRFGYSKDKLIC